ncbi:sulfatase [Balneolaceae bacterium YR4-1]|uniref:Sulfatase n=1 Tax=Halalkalibaculum roseum TaxID=2709311 RepID=A0A6M1T829_9BACT|nr:sulfatase [Halalkalibaculum roseum]NGP78095.1 sulfatase [Halalkalibaculum roseum]
MQKVIRYGLLILVFFGVQSLTVLEAVTLDSKEDRPNIVFILIDDLGWMDLEYQGSEIYKTPEIDKLAEQSLDFQQAYAPHPRCVPSRYGMMTGIFPARSKVPAENFDLLPEDKTFAHKLSNNGYRTGYIGKWHLGSEELGPAGKGFDVSIAAGEAGSPINYFFPYNDTSEKPWKEGKDPIPDLEEGEEGEYLNDRLTDEAIGFIEENQSRPFFLMLSHYAVHQPLEAPDSLRKKFKKVIANHDFGSLPEYILEGTGKTKMRQDNPTYAAMIKNLDWNIGRLLDRLQSLGLDENTIIVFTSDHGGLSNQGTRNRNLATSNFPLRAGKGWLYEGGVRVPLLVKWPGVTKPGVNEEAIISGVDYYPTFLDMALGESPDKEVDGQSFVNILQGEKQGDRGPIFWHTPRARPKGTGDTNSSAVRLGDYKLIHWFDRDEVQLYNVVKDIKERNDLSKKIPQKTEELMKVLSDWKNEWSD